MTFEGLSSMAEELNITTYFWHLRNKKAFSFNDGANGVIVIDTSSLEREREKKKIYSEELGHCTTKAFYPFQYCAEPLRRSNIEKGFVYLSSPFFRITGSNKKRLLRL